MDDITYCEDCPNRWDAGECYECNPYPDTDSYCPKCGEVLSYVEREMAASPYVAMQTGELFYTWKGSMCNFCGWSSRD